VLNLDHKVTAKGSCDEKVSNNIGNFLFVFFIGGFKSLFCASLSYIFIEKPALEARSVFVHKLSS